MLSQLIRRVGRRLLPHADADLDAYHKNGRRPWSRGYERYKAEYLLRTLADADLLERFRAGAPLPARFGEFLDERVVEYPWALTRLRAGAGKLLDAGSCLNFLHVLDQPILKHKHLSIVTLAPEERCYWQRGIDYMFGDLRALPFRDEYFDEVVCISTLEHVGMDNTRLYAAEEAYREKNRDAFLTAVCELARVCKNDGSILITVPFGRPTDFGWYQQFDGAMIDRLRDAVAPSSVRPTFYRYTDGGWQVSTRDECADCEGFDIHSTRYMDPASTRDYDPDFAAASRGIAALEIRKGGAR